MLKNPEASRRYSYGSERKASGAEVHIGMTAVESFGRGKTGRAKLTVHKDRPGFLQRPSVGVFALVSDEDGSCRWRIDPDTSVADDGGFRPTGLMEKMSRELELYHPEPRSRTQLEQSISGKSEYVRLAIDRLVAEGFANETHGARNARLVEHIKPFREELDWGSG